MVHCLLRGIGAGVPCCCGALKLGCLVRQCAFRGWYGTPLPCRLPRMRGGGPGCWARVTMAPGGSCLADLGGEWHVSLLFVLGLP